MCRAVKCRTCGKTTWAGCGEHVPSVKATVARGDWCDGTHSASQLAGAKSAKGGGFLSRIFGR